MKNSLIIFLLLIFSVSVASKLTIKIRENSGYKNDLSNGLELNKQPNASSRSGANRTEPYDRQIFTSRQEANRIEPYHSKFGKKFRKGLQAGFVRKNNNENTTNEKIEKLITNEREKIFPRNSNADYLYEIEKYEKLNMNEVRSNKIHSCIDGMISFLKKL